MSSSYGPGETVDIQGLTQDSNQNLADATSLPTAVLRRNGVDTAETVLIVKTPSSTGQYDLQFTIPSAWAIGDVVEIRMHATVGGANGGAIIWSERLGNDFIQGPVVGVAIGADIGAAPITLITYQKAEKTFALELKDLNGDAIDASGFTLRFRVETTVDTSVNLIEVTEAGGDITVSGAGNNIINVKIDETETATIAAAEHRWRLWDDSVQQVLLNGPFIVLPTSE